ncbi:MAG: helix-turn-helix transcriptional regulator, partial [Clostridia bacterium]|nr:helix-turn-helix transcriptional regulator [Clostridia bacterium]
YTNITLGELAESCGLSVAHFSRLFRLVTGHTMTDYLMRIRISKAMTLLKSQDVSVYDAAAEVGYTDPEYFSRVLRAVTGLPPREWIRQMTAEKESK